MRQKRLKREPLEPSYDIRAWTKSDRLDVWLRGAWVGPAIFFYFIPAVLYFMFMAVIEIFNKF